MYGTAVPFSAAATSPQFSDRGADIPDRQLRADIVAEVCGYSIEAAAAISRNGSHHPLFAER
jgi:hypothetical protein